MMTEEMTRAKGGTRTAAPLKFTTKANFSGQGFALEGGALRRRYCLPGLASHIPVALGLGFLGNCSCIALPPASLQSCLVRSWQAIPPPQLQPARRANIRNHCPMLPHRSTNRFINRCFLQCATHAALRDR